jgi:hypothetical protein
MQSSSFILVFWGSLELLLSVKNCKLGILVHPVWKMKSKVRMKIVLHMKKEKEKKRREEKRREGKGKKRKVESDCLTDYQKSVFPASLIKI